MTKLERAERRLERALAIESSFRRSYEVYQDRAARRALDRAIDEVGAAQKALQTHTSGVS